MTLEEYLNEHGADYCTEPGPGYEDDWEDELPEDDRDEEDDEDE